MAINSKFCSTCSESFDEKFGFCPICGAQLGEVPQPEESIPAIEEEVVSSEPTPEPFELSPSGGPGLGFTMVNQESSGTFKRLLAASLILFLILFSGLLIRSIFNSPLLDDSFNGDSLAVNVEEIISTEEEKEKEPEKKKTEENKKANKAPGNESKGFKGDEGKSQGVDGPDPVTTRIPRDMTGFSLPSPFRAGNKNRNGGGTQVGGGLGQDGDGTGGGGSGDEEGGGGDCGPGEDCGPPALNLKTTPLKILSKPRASYTDAARQAGLQGKVVLKVTFQADGTVGSVVPVSGLGSGLTERAIAAAKAIKFEPQFKGGRAVSVTKTIEYTFTIY